MVCPRCNALWDQGKNACTRCGLAIRVQRPQTAVSSSSSDDALTPAASSANSGPLGARARALNARGRAPDAAPETPVPPFISTSLPPTGAVPPQQGRRLKVKIADDQEEPGATTEKRDAFAGGPDESQGGKMPFGLHDQAATQRDTDALKWDVELPRIPD